MLDLDEAIRQVGAFGVCQIAFVTSAAIFLTLVSANIAASVFEGLVPETRCMSPGEDEVILACPVDFQRFLVPETVGGHLSHCERYNFSDDKSIVQNVTNSANITRSCNITVNQTVEDIVPCTNWEYDQSIMRSTIVSDFNLVCGDQWAGYFSQSALMLGVGVGGIVAGYVSDRIGRRHALLLASIGSAITGTVISFTSSYVGYSLARAIFGVFMYPPLLVLFVHASELTSPKYRSIVAQVLAVAFPFGFILLSLIAYALREWRNLQLTLSVPFATGILIWWCAPESPRWLSEKNRNDEAIRVLKRVAKINKIKRLPNFWENEGNSKANQSAVVDTRSEEKISIRHVFKMPHLRSASLKMFYNWCAGSCIYYALTMNAADLDGNPFVNVVINSAAEIVAVILTVPLANFFGRRLTGSASNILTGTACILVALVPAEAVLAIATVGKFGISISFSILYIHTNEIYPTAVRNLGVGLCSAISRVGAIVSPIISMIGVIVPAAPYVIFGFVSIASGILFLTLPETKGTKLPQTIEDGESLVASDRGILSKIHFLRKDHKDYSKEENAEMLQQREI